MYGSVTSIIPLIFFYQNCQILRLSISDGRLSMSDCVVTDIVVFRDAQFFFLPNSRFLFKKNIFIVTHVTINILF